MVLLTYCLLIYQPAETIVMFKSWNLSLLVKSLRDQLNHFICIYKIFLWFTKRRQILNILKGLQSQEFMYEKYNKYNPGKILYKYKTKSDRWSKLFLYGVNGICFNMTLSVLYVYIFKYRDYSSEDEEGNLIYTQKLPVTLITPFKQNTRLGFILHFIFMILPLDIYGWIIIGLDTLFTSILNCITAHVLILNGAFETIRPRCLTRLKLNNRNLSSIDMKTLHNEMLKEQNKCIRHLQKLIRISGKVEEIYNVQTLGQVMISLFEMCFCLFLLTLSFDSSFGNELTYLFSTALQLLLYCWFGNGITEASAAIPSALFKGDWLDASLKFKKSMLITMTRMKKPISFTIAKFTPLAFTTFLSMARVAYSFFTVLRSGVFESPE
uniref:Odorant receptor n=1 Tax=Holotrichia parallela TaxID=93412 RepID=A0A2P0ZPL2_HOLPA|nr:odorant receptor 47 [Holotrichia parallela]